MSDTTLMHDPEKLCPECLQATQHDQDAYWLRTYAGQAMQGMLASNRRDMDNPISRSHDAIEYATTLLQAVRESEGKNDKN